MRGLWRCVGWWLAVCVVITASVNILLVSRAPPSSPGSPDLRPNTHLSHQQQQHQKTCLKGEVYAVRESDYHRRNQHNRSGLWPLLTGLYSQLAVVRAQYTTPSTLLPPLVQTLKRDLTRRGITDDPWDLARKWGTARYLVPREAPGLGDILAALSTAPVVSADVGYKGTQLKIDLRLKGGQRVVFKPKWYSRSEMIEGEVYAGGDRHNGEIAAFHLSRLLGIPMVPLATGRRISLKRHILPVASKQLAETFFLRRGRRMCFYGVCYYCHKDASVCDDGHQLEGSVSLWLPSHLPLGHLPHPWARTYNRSRLAPWEEDPAYCKRVVRVAPYGNPSSPRLLDLMDVAVFDFLIQNGDRHHYTVVSSKPRSALILLDNGKRLRQMTYERLETLSGGGLSGALGELLSQDPIHPVLSPPHLKALDRRLVHILAALAHCKERRGGWHRVLF